MIYHITQIFLILVALFNAAIGIIYIFKGEGITNHVYYHTLIAFIIFIYVEIRDMNHDKNKTPGGSIAQIINSEIDKHENHQKKQKKENK